VDEICRTLGATRKKLRSEARFYFGGPVKNIQGIIRFNKTLADIAKNAQQTLSSVHQYYDQSHFINDFKARAGITPSQYRRLCQSYPQIQYTPNFLSMERETFLQFIFSRRDYLA
jgi:AraC-like DNA-binding protein